MSNSFSSLQGALRLKPEPGKLAFYYLLISHGLIGATLWVLLPMAPIGLWLIILLLPVSFLYYLALFWLRMLPFSPVALELQGGAARLVYRDGARIEGVLHQRQFATPLLTVVSVRVARRTRRMALFADQVDPDTFRRLRVQLRFPLDVSGERANWRE